MRDAGVRMRLPGNLNLQMIMETPQDDVCEQPSYWLLYHDLAPVVSFNHNAGEASKLAAPAYRLLRGPQGCIDR